MGDLNLKDFQKVDLRVGEILEVEEIPDADKIYKLVVDVGERRIVVAGVKEHYTRDELIGMKVAVVTNLEPKELKGVLSHGMLLAATAKGADGAQRMSIVTFEKHIQNGAKIS